MIRFSSYGPTPAHAGPVNKISLFWGWTACPLGYEYRYVLGVSFKFNNQEYGFSIIREKKMEGQ